MLANFDQNGDAALNLVELQAALGVLFQHLQGNRQDGEVGQGAGQGNGLMNQARRGEGHDQFVGHPEGGGPGRGGRGPANRGGGSGGGGGKGGRGR